MYRLLVVTGSPEVESMFASMDGWEAMGYKQPRIRHSTQDALECMKKHHIDALAISEGAEFIPFVEHIEEKEPNLPIFPIRGEAESQRAVMRELSQLLTRLHTDDSNDDYDESYYLKVARDAWMKRLISGLEPNCSSIREHHRLLRCREALDKPCVLVKLSMPGGDTFISGRWHYGSERLETALRNFFGNGHEHMLISLAVLSPERVNVLACQDARDASPLMSERALDFIKETVSQIDKYLGLTMEISEVCRMGGLCEFAARKQSI